MKPPGITHKGTRGVRSPGPMCSMRENYLVCSSPSDDAFALVTLKSFPTGAFCSSFPPLAPVLNPLAPLSLDSRSIHSRSNRSDSSCSFHSRAIGSASIRSRRSRSSLSFCSHSAHSRRSFSSCAPDLAFPAPASRARSLRAAPTLCPLAPLCVLFAQKWEGLTPAFCMREPQFAAQSCKSPQRSHGPF
jgi:hypothetical protein